MGPVFQPPVPKVSVGIPTYNRPEGLRKTLQCITAQNFRDLEIIVSDNCSPSPEVQSVILEFASSDPRIVSIHQPENLGALRNFFYVARQARGRYFMWAADDDWWDPDFIATAASLLDKTPSAVIGLPRFVPFLTLGQPPKRLPPSFDKIREFEHQPLFDRLLRYIYQKEVYGKAHIIYGLMRREQTIAAIDQTLEIISPLTDAYSFNSLDTVFNAVLLSQGDLVTDERCLRRYHHAPRRSDTKKARGFIQRLLGYDQTAIIYFDCFYPLIESLKLTTQEKNRLRRAVQYRKFSFIMERIGRRLLVYKIYWHFKKRLCFKPVVA